MVLHMVLAKYCLPSFCRRLFLVAFFVSFLFPLILGPASAHRDLKLNLADISGLASLKTYEIESALPKTKEEKALRFFQFTLTDNTRVSLITFKSGAKKSLRLAPQLAARTEPTSKSVERAQALLGVNGGYFNLSDGVSASYVVLNGAVKADATANKALVENPKLKPFLAQIFNRSELRVVHKKDSPILEYEIAVHDAPLKDGYLLVDSLQGGPRLLPDLTAEKEAFVRTEEGGLIVDSIGVRRTAARTAIGFDKHGQVFVVCVAGKKQDEFSAGITLSDLSKLLSRLGAVEALNFDGGTSATMIVGRQMVVGRHPETLVKSTLCVVEPD